MLDEAKLEKRLTTLEQTVVNLQNQLSARSDSENQDWLKAMAISPSNESIFLEALEYGRAYRQSDRPMDETDETS